MTQISFTVPGQPVGKARARVTRHGTYTPATTVGYEERIIVAAREAMFDAPAVKPPPGTAIHLYAQFLFEIPASWSKAKRRRLMGEPHLQKPDWDNLGKAVSDALTGVVYWEDCKVWRAVIEKYWTSAVGETQITVTW